MTRSPLSFEFWTPPIEGVKATVDHRPSAREAVAQQYAAEVLQNRYERWLQWHYSRILASIRRDLGSLDHVPDMTEVAVIVTRYDSDQMDVLRRMWLQVYPQAAAMVIPDDTLKSLRMRETKAELTPEQQRILQWIEEQLGVNVNAMSTYTMSIIDAIRMQSDGPVDFMNRLQSSGLFTTARARRIAVTETNSAVNQSIAQSAEEAADGREMVKTWRTSGRTNVRDTHRVMADITIPNEEFYRVPTRKGGIDLMMYPGDRAHGASPENFMNCHCKSFPRLAEYE
ncbi:hypothetical protein JS82_05225 [Methanomassiliicoccaceae archaeon DOK]|nr:hypothetical protein JS82_05225 [Methanomassiliicoccaceae archaeon DOK]